MITGYNPLTNPQITNPISKSTQSQPQAGQIPAASNFFASVINQLLMQMEMQSETESGIDSTDPSLFLGNNQTVQQTGGGTPYNQPNNPYNMTQMMGSAFSTMPLNVSDLLNNLGFSSNNTQLTGAITQNTPPGPNNSLNVQSINPYKMLEANNSAPASNTYGSLQFQTTDPSVLNGVLGGKLKGMGEIFVKAGQQFNVDPALLAAIAQHETGNGKSEAAYTKNNIAGMMGANGLKSYASVDDSIMDMARNVGKYYLGSGLTTISKIGAKYAPVGAGNDPSGLNNYWVTGVTHYYNQLRTPIGKTNTFTSTV